MHPPHHHFLSHAPPPRRGVLPAARAAASLALRPEAAARNEVQPLQQQVTPALLFPSFPLHHLTPDLTPLSFQSFGTSIAYWRTDLHCLLAE